MTSPGTYTYSGDPASSRKDAVRSLLSDTGGSDGSFWLLSDEEITYFDAQVTPSYDDAFMSAAVCADIVSGRFAGEAAISADGVSISTDAIQAKYRELASSLRTTFKLIAGAGGLPLIGGIDAFTVCDPGVRPKEFAIGMDDNYRAGAQNYSRWGGYGYDGYDGAWGWMESEPW